MRKLLFIAVMLTVAAANGNIYMGQTYYAHFLSSKLGLGSEFTKQHTKKEWDALFNDGAQEFYEKYDIQKGTFDAKQRKHIEAFLKYYAKDSDAKAVCQ